MENGDNDHVIFNHKQGFQDCKAYAELEKQLNNKPNKIQQIVV